MLTPPMWAAPLQTMFNTLYTEPHRHYHTLAHIKAMLAHFQKHKHLVEAHEEIEAAIWFHDAYYDPHQADNEERSAQFAITELHQLGWPRTRIQRVADMVLATKHHPIQQYDADIQFFLDLDLAILGTPAHVYQAYTQAVRREYAWTPDALYRTGRAQVLDHFLARPIIYGTPELHHLWEATARHNLRTELVNLGTKSQPDATRP
jgi:predicted metal-dependent HD superfamily phosphohydrolase